MAERIVITGMGAVTPIGIGCEEFWTAAKEGRSGVGRITSFDPSQHAAQIAAEVRDFDPSQFMDKKETRRMDRFAQFAVAAARMALEDAGLTITPANRDRIGVYIGSGIGGINTWESEVAVLLQRGPGRVSPFMVPMMIPDMAASQVSITFGARGPNAAEVAACASASYAIAHAAAVIQRGEADIMITGGSEAAITPLMVAGFANMRALSRRNDDPAKASRPFDAQRDGFVIGEGAGILILESLASAQKRGAKIYAELAGCGLTSDACHITAMDESAEGATRAMRHALHVAGLTPAEVDYINAHGTSTEMNDKTETLAIKQALGEYAFKVPISSTKSEIGHLLGASGAVELIATILAIRDQVLPPTINYETPDPDCDLDYVPNVARPARIEVALSNSFGFGGHNACLVMKKFEG
ncbi:MAG: beta-ketoacyl-ACP synthase II [Abditibacteriales bacterium]|nr:beta-ketoacyl-ACP synthase II [Abditibacteriales bacterium]MDW8366705.1 beta-ketoacyl-ACP synthase II [Abditibacteriales bacterium]